MKADQDVKELLKAHADEVNANELEPLILDVCLKCRERGLAQIRETLSHPDVGLKREYNRAVEKIIKTFLRNSDLLEP